MALDNDIKSKLGSKLWRLSHLYTIITKDNQKTILKLNFSQRKILTDFKHPRKIILKSRQQGISTLYLAYNLDDCIFKANFSAGIQSYGKDEAKKLSDRARLMWEEFPEAIKKELGITLVSDNQNGMAFSNGSILKIGNFRGDTLQSLHVSELGKIALKYPEKAKELNTGAFEAVSKNNKITIESTAEGKSGLFYDKWKIAYLKSKTGEKLTPFDFQAIFLSWIIDPDCRLDEPVKIPPDVMRYLTDLEFKLQVKLENEQKWWYAAKHDQLKADMKREYPSYPEEAFEQSVEGTYYQHEFPLLKIKPELYEPGLKVHMAMDLGMNDTFSIGFFQIKTIGNKEIPMIIGEYSSNGHGIGHYAEVCSALAKIRGYIFGKTYVPHDIKVRELIAGKTRWDAMKEYGFDLVLVRRHRVLDGIEATRQFLKIVEIDDSCEGILLAVQNYRKQYNPKLGVFLDSPVHDEHSHPADMLRCMAMGYKYSTPTDNYSVGVKRGLPSSSTVMRKIPSGYDI